MTNHDDVNYTDAAHNHGLKTELNKVTDVSPRYDNCRPMVDQYTVLRYI